MPSRPLPPEPPGGFFPMDEDGFVINPCARERIGPEFQPVLEEVIGWYAKTYEARLHSVWVRGSLPRGLYRPGLSDLDFFALLDDPACVRWAILPVPKTLTAYPVELGVHPFHQRMAERHPHMAMVLATQSLPLWPATVELGLPRYRPDRSMMLHYRWLADDWQTFCAGDRSAPAVRAVAKVVLRTGFELVMERLGKFTPDLYWCWKAFGDFYPAQGGAMEGFLAAYLDPTGYNPGFHEKGDDLVNFILEALRGQGHLPMRNPESFPA